MVNFMLQMASNAICFCMVVGFELALPLSDSFADIHCSVSVNG